MKIENLDIMKEKVFISGRITGDPYYLRKFKEAERRLVKHYRVETPFRFRFLWLPLVHFPWWVCMVVCLWHLLGCSTVYMLSDWTESRGARIENRVARFFHKTIIYEGK